MMIRKLCSLIALSLLFTILGGCFNSLEVNELAIVMGMGIDKVSGDGDYSVTVQLANAGGLKSPEEDGGSGGGTAYLNMTQEGLGIQDPLYSIARMCGRKLYTGHTQVIVLGNEAAKGEISGILDFFVRSSEGQFTEQLLIARGEAAEIFEGDSGIEKLPSEHLQKMLESQSYAALIRPMTIIEFLCDMLTKTTAPTAPIIELSGEKSEMKLSGTAVFKNGHMIGELSPEETRGMMLVRGDVEGGIIRMEAIGSYVGLVIDKSETRTRVNKRGDVMWIEVEIEQLCSLMDTGTEEDLKKIEVREEVEREAEKVTLGLLERTLERTRDLGADIYGFGEALYREYPQEMREKLEIWEEEYKNLRVEFNVDIKLAGTGAILRPLVPETDISQGGEE